VLLSPHRVLVSCCVQAGTIDKEEIEVRILVHQAHAGRIIGKGGEKVKKIRAVSVFYVCQMFIRFIALLWK